MWFTHFNGREVATIIALIAGLAIAAIATERGNQPVMQLPAFGKPICPTNLPTPAKWFVDT